VIENRISRKHSQNKRTLPSRWKTSVQHPAITYTQGQEWGIWEIRYSRQWGIYTISVRFITNLFIQSGVWHKCALSHSELEEGDKNTQLCMRMACSTMTSKATSLHAFNVMYECMKTRMTDRHHVNFFQSIWLPQYHFVQSSYLQWTEKEICRSKWKNLNQAINFCMLILVY